MDTSLGKKDVMNNDDLFILLHFHWVNDTSVFPQERQRIQFSFITLVEAGTGARLGSVLSVPINQDKLAKEYMSDEEGADSNEESDSIPPNEDYALSLLYEDVEIISLPNPDGERDVIVMIVDISRTKGSSRLKQQ
jgi:hypothetical protein